MSHTLCLLGNQGCRHTQKWVILVAVSWQQWLSKGASIFNITLCVYCLSYSVHFPPKGCLPCVNTQLWQVRKKMSTLSSDYLSPRDTKLKKCCLAWMFCMYFLSYLHWELQYRMKTSLKIQNKAKVKLSRYRPEQAHGRSGRWRPRIFLTFGTRKW
jgi:hypothetical protein